MTIRTSITALVVVAIALLATAYVRSRSIQRRRREKQDRLRDARQAYIEQCAASEAEQCDFKPDVCATLTSLVDQARGSMLRRVELLESGQPVAVCTADESIGRCQPDVQSIETLLFERRRILPPTAFGVMHDIRTLAVAFEATIRGMAENSDLAASAGDLARLREQYERAATLYDSLLDEVHGFLGVCA